MTDELTTPTATTDRSPTASPGEPRHPQRRDDTGSILPLTLVLFTLGAFLVSALAVYSWTILRSRPPIEDRNAAAETAKGAMRMAMMLQRDAGPESCFDAVAPFQLNGLDVEIDCIPLSNSATETNYYETGRNRLSVITTYTGQEDAGNVAAAFSATGAGAAKSIDGDVLVTGGHLDVETADIALGGSQPPTLWYSNTPTATAPAPDQRYRVAGAPIGCTTGSTDGLGATYVTSGGYACTDQPWWEFAGNDYDDFDAVVDRTYPVLPEMPSYTRGAQGVLIDGALGNGGARCYAYFPGRYNSPVTLSGTGDPHTPTGPGAQENVFYFASGVYYFTQPLEIIDGAKVVMGQGRHDGCTFDSEAVYDEDSPKNHEITGEGVTLIFGDGGRLELTDSSLRVNLRISSPTTRGSESMSIRTVSGASVPAPSAGFIEVPEDRVQVGEYPPITDGAGNPILDVNGNPQPDPTDMSGTQPVSGYQFRLDDSATPIPYVPSAVAWNDPVVYVNLQNGSDPNRNEFVVDGQIFVPNAAFEIETGANNQYVMNLGGGVVSSIVDLDVSALPASGDWFAGVNREWVQRRVRLEVSVEEPDGAVTNSAALFQIHQDRSYAVNAWSVDTLSELGAPQGGGTDGGGTDGGGTDGGGTDGGGTDGGGTDGGGTDGGGTDGGGTGGNDGPTHPTQTGDSGEPIGNHPEVDYCTTGQTSWTHDFGAGTWLRETWNFTNSTSTGNYGEDIFVGVPDAWDYQSDVLEDWGGGVGPAGQSNYFGVRFTAMLNVPDNCAMELRISGDDGYALYVDGVRTAEHWGNHGTTHRSAPVTLQSGENLVVVEWYEWGGNADIDLQWRLTGG